MLSQALQRNAKDKARFSNASMHSFGGVIQIFFLSWSFFWFLPSVMFVLWYTSPGNLRWSSRKFCRNWKRSDSGGSALKGH